MSLTLNGLLSKSSNLGFCWTKLMHFKIVPITSEKDLISCFKILNWDWYFSQSQNLFWFLRDKYFNACLHFLILGRILDILGETGLDRIYVSKGLLQDFLEQI